MAESDEDKTPAREKIVEYAQGLYDYFRTPGGVIYAQRTGHPVARPMKAQGSQNVMSHRQELIIGMRRDAVGSFSGTALKEALEILEAEAFDSPARPVHTRVGSCAKAPGVTWLDLGRDDGQSVRIAPGEWTVRRPTPDEVTWRRTAMTGELPMPVREQGFDGVDALLGLCNFKDGASAALAIAFLVGCLEPDVPVPAPFLTGPQGAGKSTAGRMLVRVVEGMTGDLRRPPKDEESLITAASAGWVTGLDNLSHLTADMSDLMCCVITGAENVKRALYSDGDVVRQTLRRPVLLTGIDVGVLRPDLAERLLAMKLERPTVRRSEADIWSAFTEALPATLGSLLDVTAAVRAADCDVPEDLRMADFARLCGRLDKAYSLGALDAYRAALDDLNDDVIEGDQLAQLVLRWAPVTCKAGPVRYGSTELLHVLNAEESALMRPKGWPTTGKVLSDRLKRLQPTLASRGVLIEWGRTKTARYIEIKAISPVVPAARPPAEQPPLYAATG